MCGGVWIVDDAWECKDLCRVNQCAGNMAHSNSAQFTHCGSCLRQVSLFPRLTVICVHTCGNRCDDLLARIAVSPPNASIVQLMDNLSDEVRRGVRQMR